MAPSFTYPKNLLHQNTEPQWFPKPREDHESSLDALEVAEEAHLEFLRSIAQKEAPDPVGMATSKAPSANPPAPYGAPAPDPNAATATDVVYPPEPASTTRTRFWNQPRTPAPAGASFSSPVPTRRMDMPSLS